MGLLDDDYVPPWTPPKPRRYEKQTVLSQEARDLELNNFERPKVTEDYSDSIFADRV
jgi:hypothetical protein